MSAYNQVKEVSAVLFYVSECYELFQDVGNVAFAEALGEVLVDLGNVVVRLCREHFVETGEIIPRFAFSEIPESDDMIVTFDSLSQSVRLKLLAPKSSLILKNLANELIRIERTKVAPSTGHDVIETILGMP